jgi:hypothetical protein
MPDEHLQTQPQLDIILPTLEKRSFNAEDLLADNSKHSFEMITHG